MKVKIKYKNGVKEECDATRIEEDYRWNSCDGGAFIISLVNECKYVIKKDSVKSIKIV